VFGSQGGEDYGRKWIVLNRERIGAVPVNAGEPDRWDDCTIDLSLEQIRRLRLQNQIVVETETADCFKFADLALAVQLADGRWAESEHADGVWCSTPGWLYDEGKAFSGKTPGIEVSFKAR